MRPVKTAIKPNAGLSGKQRVGAVAEMMKDPANQELITKILTPIVTPRRVAMTDRLRDLYASTDIALSLARRLQQKLFGENETAKPRGNPVGVEAWLAATQGIIDETQSLLASLNDRIEAE